MKILIQTLEAWGGFSFRFLFFLTAAGLITLSSSASDKIYQSKVKPFFSKYCIECHGPKKSKGDITLDALDADMKLEQDLKHWEKVLDAIKSGEMPPKDEKQPTSSDKEIVSGWIRNGLKKFIDEASSKEAAPTLRRLTNFEYQNTMRDLLGIDMEYTRVLPKDPEKHYHFNNTSKYMKIGVDQLDMYEKAARYALNSAIVIPEEKPNTKVVEKFFSLPGVEQKTKGKKKLSGAIGTFSSDVRYIKTAAKGFDVKDVPNYGAFKLQMKLSGSFSGDLEELPFRIIMGPYIIPERNAHKEVFSVIIKKGQKATVYETNGRLEDIPHRSGTFRIRPQNLLHVVTLNKKPQYTGPAPQALLEWVKFEYPYFEQWPPKHHKDILFDSPLRDSQPEVYVKEVLKRFMAKAFRRPVQSLEVEHFFKIYEIAFKSMNSMEKAMRETLTMVLISPDFLYHVESGSTETRQYELASKLSYFLWGTMPDAELTKLASEKKLYDKKTILNQVERLLADKRSMNFVKNFSQQWLSLEKLKSIPINKDLFPNFLSYRQKNTEVGDFITIRDDMQEETVSFIAELIRRNAPVSNIVDSDFAMLNYRLAKHYGVPGVKNMDFQAVQIKPEYRIGGLLTQGSILVGNSTGSAPHTIYRAVWLREAILGDDVREPPADVPALVDSAGKSAEEAPSIKELLEKHRQQESCRDCHVRLDPWGIPFEHYNAIGKYQPVVPKEGTRVPEYFKKRFSTYEKYYEHLETLNTVKLEAEARVPHGPKVNGMEDLKKHLIKDRIDDIAENVIRRFITYGIGRELSFRDRFAIEQLSSQSKKNGYNMKDMIILVCQSDIFMEVNSK